MSGNYVSFNLKLYQYSHFVFTILLYGNNKINNIHQMHIKLTDLISNEIGLKPQILQPILCSSKGN